MDPVSEDQGDEGEGDQYAAMQAAHEALAAVAAGDLGRFALALHALPAASLRGTVYVLTRSQLEVARQCGIPYAEIVDVLGDSVENIVRSDVDRDLRHLLDGDGPSR